MEVVQQYSPYLEDRQTVRNLDDEVRRLREAVAEFSRQLAVLNERLGPRSDP